MNSRVCRILVASGLLFSVARPNICAALAADDQYRVVTSFPVGGDGRWDLIAVDPTANRVYIPRSTHTQVIDEKTGDVVGDIKDTPGVHAVAIVPDVNRGFTSNGRGKSVTIFDLKSLQVIGTAPVGDNPDAIIYDPASKRVIVLNAGSNSATIIDPAAAPSPADAAPTTITLGGKPELAVADGRGRVYVNLEDKNSVAVVDTNAMKVIDTWAIEGGEEPTGIAIDPERHRLFIGCHNQVMAILDAVTGKTLATVPIGKGVDGCAFDPRTHEAFASCGDGTLTVVKETAANKFEVTQTVPTRRGARTLALDPTTHTLYLPTAEFDAPTTAESRPSIKPGTFMLLVVSR